MSLRALRAALLCLCAFACALPARAAPLAPQRQFVSDAVCLLETLAFNGDVLRASAVIARHPRLAFTAAHPLFDGSRWLTTYRLLPGWNAEDLPDAQAGLRPRGLRHYAGYADAVIGGGPDADASFDLDFVVMYAFSSLGPALPARADLGAAVRGTTVRKRLVGYPGLLDIDGSPGFAWQHATHGFNLAATRRLGAYHLFRGVTTGPGMSGGPLLVDDTSTGTTPVAGILLSGTASTAGVHVLDDAALAMANDALVDVLGVRVAKFVNRQALRLPDQDKRFRERVVKVSGLAGTVRSLDLGLVIDTPKRGDLDAYLVSPAGRVQWVLRRRPGSPGAVRIAKVNYTARYAGARANGKWRLRLRDVGRGGIATFRSVALTLGALPD